MSTDPWKTVLDSLLTHFKTKWEGNKAGYSTNISLAGSLSLSFAALISLDLISWEVRPDFCSLDIVFQVYVNRDAL